MSTDAARSIIKHGLAGTPGMANPATRLLADIRQAAPAIIARSAEIETARRLPPDLVDALRSIGVFHMFVPRSHDLPEDQFALQFEARSDFVNAVGTVQGGIVTAMLDDAAGPVATALLGGRHMVPTVELKTSFMRPARVGRLCVEARVIHRGREIVFLAADMKNSEGKLIATGTATGRIHDWRNVED